MSKSYTRDPIKHAEKTQRVLARYEEDILSIISKKPATYKELAKRLNVSAGCFFRGSTCYASRALYSLLDKETIIAKSNTRVKQCPMTFYRNKDKEVERDYPASEAVCDKGYSTNGTDEQELIDAINRFLAKKKRSMTEGISSDVKNAVSEREYYKNLCEGYKETIDKLEMQLAQSIIKF